MNKNHILGVSFLLVLCLSFSIYLIGLKGNFLFDDYPNLQDLGAYGVIDSWDKVRAFVFNGFAGPTGRPISLASFLIDANIWPADPFSFKYTNLMIHLLNGILLYWAIILLLQYYKYEDHKVYWIALVSTSIWILHPYFVSTTLYIVQRMAQLTLLFSLVGIIGYLKGCLIIHNQPRKAYALMTIFLVLGTLLATFSKENGALLPLLVLVIEFCNPIKNNKPMWQWRAIFLWLPSLAIVMLLAKYITLADNPWPNRNFNMVERLYSEARIVTEYLYNLFIPQIELKGLYQDGFLVSRSITQPISTLYSIFFLSTLLSSAFYLRKKYPLYALAVLFFFSAHLMESTVVGLELYFEHRNYMAAIFLFLPVVSGLYLLRSKIDIKLVNLIVILIFLILSFFTYERAKLWGNTEELQLYWAKISPNSPRAQNSIATILFEQGRYEESNEFLEKAIQRMPSSALLSMRLLLQKVYVHQATKQDFEEIAKRLKKQPFDAQAIQALRTLIEFISNNHLSNVYGDNSLILINYLEQYASQYNQLPLFQRLMPYLKAKIYLDIGDSNQALNEYLNAVLKYNDVEAGMMMVAELGSAKYPHQALILLEKVKEIYKKESTSSLRRSRAEYDFEILRVEKILNEQIKHKEVL
ncbi:tetratricopeptide repeat protein [Acinetobacter sp. ANC 4640]